MPLYKSAQLEPKNEVIIFDDRPQFDDVVEMHHPEETFSFSFPQIPEAGVIEVSEDDNSETPVKSKKENGPKDAWDWQAGGMPNLMVWVQERLNHIPDMSGSETTALERAMSYLKRLNNEISRAISNDFDGEIDVKMMEVARKWIFEAISKLEDVLEQNHEHHYKKKKSSSEEGGIVKEARTPYTGGIIVTVPLLISRCARLCVNATVSAGHDLPKLYEEQVKKYSLNIREQAELMQHLEDLGFPLRSDRLFLPDEEVNVRDGKGDLASNYKA